jgi:DNA (cytosine-5)-methyltransferase 1
VGIATVSAYYNEHDRFAAAWLRELIKAGLIADGEVDERSIEDVSADDVRGFTQCHFFAGIGGWSYALRLAGWPDDRHVWTGSCPCQPFSVAGKGEGADDSRDLWPAWRPLIAKWQPPTIFGEQVASSDGLFWLDRVFVDLEAQAYAVGAADLAAAGVSAPHKRQRLYFVADASGARRQQDTDGASSDEVSHGRQSHRDHVVDGAGESHHSGMADANGYHEHWWSGPLQVGWNAIEAEVERGGRKYRAQWRIKPGLSLLAPGVSNRVERLCGFGNAIVPQVAAAFIEAYCEARGLS